MQGARGCPASPGIASGGLQSRGEVTKVAGMKATIAIIILVLLCLVSAGGLWRRHNQAEAQKRADEAQIRQLSNQVVETSGKLKAQTEVNSNLTTSLQAKTSDLEKTSAQLSETRGLLGQTEAEVKATKEQLELTKAEVLKRDSRIAELENANSTLDKQASDMKLALGDLETKIADTQRKLAASEGDREFLLKELKRLQAEKVELERRFTDLIALREQVKKLKEELAISRRLDWIRRGLYGSTPKKGGELLQSGFAQPPTTPKPDVDLNVEIRRDGSSTVVPATNAPPGTGTPNP